jgi:hypothetical protein
MLKQDRMQRYNDEARLIEEAMAQNDSKAGFQHMQKWYKKKSGVQLPMSHQRLTTVSTKYTALYAAAKRMKSGKEPGPSWFRGDTIKRWARADEGTSEATCFEKLASLCKRIFLTGEIPQAMKEGTLVLLP